MFSKHSGLTDVFHRVSDIEKLSDLQMIKTETLARVGKSLTALKLSLDFIISIVISPSSFVLNETTLILRCSEHYGDYPLTCIISSFRIYSHII